MKLLTVTACYYPNLKTITRLMESGNILGIPVLPYGMGEGYTIMKAKIDGLVTTLKAHLREDFTHALYTDGDDSFITWDRDSIVAAYAFQGSPPCLISAERECAPIKDIKNQFPIRDDYRYPCAGGFMGEIPYLIETLQWLKRYQDNSHIECNDQAYWQMGIIEDNIAMIDSECEVFQTMSGEATEHLWWDQENRAWFNKVTETFPCVLHFNGRTEGIERFFGVWKTGRG